MHRLRLVLLRVIGPCLALVLLLGGISEARDQAWADLQVGDKVAVIEHLRLKVPQESRQDWMVAERGSWEPWLKHQPGFLGRDLFWDPATEEGTLLIQPRLPTAAFRNHPILSTLLGHLEPQVLNHGHLVTNLKVGPCLIPCLRNPSQQQNQCQTRSDDPKQNKPESMHSSAPLQKGDSLATDALFPSLRPQAFVGGGLHTHSIWSNTDR